MIKSRNRIIITVVFVPTLILAISCIMLSIKSNNHQYGFFGIAFAYLAGLISGMVIILNKQGVR